MSEQETNKCVEIREHLHFLDEAELNSEQTAVVQAHLESCAACRAELESLRALLATLKAVPVPAMRPAFTEEAFARVRTAEVATAASWYKPVVGIAASVLVAGVAFLLVKPEQSATVPYDLVVSAPKQEDVVQDLRIAFNSPGVLENVGIEIVLPESVSLEGSDQQRLSWQTSLYKGKNELRLPLLKSKNNEIAEEDAYVLARLTHGDKVKEFRVRLQRAEQV